MNKLGIIISTTCEGAGKRVASINCGPEREKYCVDIRPLFKYVHGGGEESKNVLMFMSFSEHDCILTLVSEGGYRGGDNSAMFIFIPHNIRISGEELVKIIKEVSHCLFVSEIPSEDKERLYEIFNEEYSLKSYVIPVKPSSADNLYAVRYFNSGNMSLEEILGTDRYQLYYNDYSCIFLIDKESSVHITQGVKVMDLSDRKLEKHCILLPPEKEELEDVFGNIRIMLECNGKPLKQILNVKFGEEVKVTVKRSGFENIQYSLKAENEEQKLLAISKNEVCWKKTITRDLFKIKLENTDRYIDGAKILIEGKSIDERPVLDEEKCKKVHVSISVKGYDVYEKECNLLALPSYIELKKQVYEFKSDVELADGNDGKLSIKSKYIDENTINPLKGYVRNEVGKLVFDRNREWKQRFIGFMFAFLLALLIGVAFWFFGLLGHTDGLTTKNKNTSYHKNKGTISTSNEQSTNPPEDLEFNLGNKQDTIGTEESESSSEDATVAAGGTEKKQASGTIDGTEIENGRTIKKNSIEYLEKGVYIKKKMESNPQLKGLFDAINNCNADIKSKYSDLYRESAKLKKICDQISKLKKKRVYTVGDTIKYKNYINFLEKHIPKSSSSLPQ